ncbi:MAG: hypothetical protein BGO09_13500 [Bacteroidetes bacterium 47-18]|nr:MAG: hypothetical protein BGO09_13500 [Bacteroidetes bacterium 47-18]
MVLRKILFYVDLQNKCKKYIVKKIISIVVLLLSFISVRAQSNNYSEVYFTGYGGPYKVYVNDRLVTNISNHDILKLKLYSKGRFTVTFQNSFLNLEGFLQINDFGTYYYMGGNKEGVLKKTINNQAVDQATFEAFTKGIEKRKKVTYEVINMEEDINRPLGKIEAASVAAKVQGSCFVIDKNGYLLTNYHVVEQAKSVHIKGIGGDFSTLYAADVVAFDSETDLAILKLKNSALKFPDLPYSLKTNTAQQGSKSYVLGYPLTQSMGDEIKLTEGLISAKSGYKGSASQYQISAAVQPGNSGCPIFDEDGNVLGVVNGKLSNAEGVGYAVKSLYIKTFLETTEKVNTESTVIANPEKSSFLKRIPELGGFIFIVEANNQ